MGKYYSYMRISTKEERRMQKYNRQSAAIEKYMKDNKIDCDNHNQYKDDASGKNFDRPEWKSLENELQPGDTIIFKDISRFTREAENGLAKYMELMNKGVDLIFLDNVTISTPYIKQLLDVAKKQNLVAKISLENTIELLLIVELDRAEQERKILIKRITDGIKNSGKKQGRKPGQIDKMTDELHSDIVRYLNDRSIKQVDLMSKHKISRNTLKKYVALVQAEQEQ